MNGCHSAGDNPSVLLWCEEGKATVNSPEKVLSMSAGDLAIAPQGAFVTGKGLVLEIRFPEMRLAGVARIVHLGMQWSQRMVFEYSRSVLGQRQLSADLEALCGRTHQLVEAPVMPKSGAAAAVAHTLLIQPAAATALEEFAEREQVSSRTLQRQFLQGTGLVFSEWRASVRVYVAAQLLQQDHTIAEAAKIVGFGATSSLTRAFKRHTGKTPGALGLGVVSTKTWEEVPQIPTSTMFARTDSDQVLWIYQGTATVTTPGYCRFVSVGDTITIPAGTATRVDVSAGSIALPVPLAAADSVVTLRHAVLAHQGGFQALEDIDHQELLKVSHRELKKAVVR